MQTAGNPGLCIVMKIMKKQWTEIYCCGWHKIMSARTLIPKIIWTKKLFSWVPSAFQESWSQIIFAKSISADVISNFELRAWTLPAQKALWNFFMNNSCVELLDCPLKRPNAFQALSSIISEVGNYLRWFFRNYSESCLLSSLCSQVSMTNWWVQNNLKVKHVLMITPSAEVPPIGVLSHTIYIYSISHLFYFVCPQHWFCWLNSNCQPKQQWNLSAKMQAFVPHVCRFLVSRHVSVFMQSTRRLFYLFHYWMVLSS